MSASTAWAASVYESEPNNTRNTANVIAVGDTVSGSALRSQWYDEDYYAIDLPKPGRVTLNLRFPANLGTTTAYTVKMYNVAGTEIYAFTVGASEHSGSWLAGQGTFAPAGRLYVRIYGNDTYPTWGKTYTLNVGLTPGNVEAEPNNETRAATLLALGATISGSALRSQWYDEDYYAVDIPKAGRVTLNLKFPANLGTTTAYTVKVYNAIGAEIYAFTVAANEYNGSWLAGQGTFAPADRLYIRIYGNDTYPTWGKTYTLNVGLTPGNVEAEPNNETRTATLLALGATISGSALRSQWYDEDYYAFDAPKGRLAVDLKFPANLGTTTAYTVRIYDAAGTELYKWDISASPHNTTLAASLPGGRTYVRVYGNDTYPTWGKTYTLRVAPAPLSLTATPTPTVQGTAKVGLTLTANAGAWAPAPVKLSYQWLRDGKAIAGATKSTYKLVGADAKKKVSVRVTGSKAGYTTVAKTSATKTVALGTLTATPTPKIAGTARVGELFAAISGSWKPAPVTLTYQWLRNGKAIAKATGPFYVLLKADKGKRISVKVTGSKVSYKAVAKTSAVKTIK